MLFDIVLIREQDSFTARTRNVVGSSSQPRLKKNRDRHEGVAVCNTHASMVKSESGTAIGCGRRPVSSRPGSLVCAVLARVGKGWAERWAEGFVESKTL